MGSRPRQRQHVSSNGQEEVQRSSSHSSTTVGSSTAPEDPVAVTYAYYKPCALVCWVSSLQFKPVVGLDETNETAVALQLVALVRLVCRRLTLLCARRYRFALNSSR